MPRNLVLAVLIAAVAGLVGWLIPGDARRNDAFLPGVRLVGTATAAPRALEERIEAIGTTASWESIEIRPSVTELVREIHFEDGQQVEAGQLLVTLLQDEEIARRDEARANLAEQERELRRIEGLVASKSLSANQLDERRTLRDVARARLEAAEAALRDRSIRAPFAGVLGLRGPSPGSLLTPQSVVTTLDEIAILRLDFPVSSLLLSKLRPGLELRASTPALPQERFAGTVTGIDSRVNPVDRSVKVRARLDNSTLRLKPGLLMNVELLDERREALVIPESAVIHYQREHYVFRVAGDAAKRVERRDIEVGLRVPGFVEVLSGLAPGDVVVTEGLASVREGDPVTVRDGAPAKGAP
ncbi:MAG: efflux RND transporter periplasmic adaptor subunit [Gammaproteobacteria bacterium]